MGFESNNNAELEELIQAISEGSLSAQEYRQLEELLSQNVDARAEFIRAMAFEAMLMQEFPPSQPLPESVISPTAFRQEYLGWPRLLAYASVIGCVLMMATAFLYQRSVSRLAKQVDVDQELLQILSPQIATLSAVSVPTETLIAGNRLTAGELEVHDGVIELLFDCGATVHIEGPARLVLESEFLAFLEYGGLTADVPKGVDGFIVRTPTSHVRDLGTSFGLRVSKTGATELHVLEGSVEATSLQKQGRWKEVVSQKHAMLFRADSVEELTYDGDRFSRPATSGDKLPPLVHWSFDEVEGNQFFGGDNLYPFTLLEQKRNLQSETDLLPASGVFGNCLNLTGDGQFAASDYLGIANAQPRSVAFWVRIAEPFNETAGNCLLSWGIAEPQRKWEMSWNRHTMSGQMGALRVGFGRGHVIGSTDLRDGLWHHVAVVFHGGAKADLATHIKLYVDGNLEKVSGRRSQSVLTSTNDPTSNPVMLGRYIDHRSKFVDRYFRGQIDELYIAEGILTHKQIASIHNHNELQR